MRQLTCLRWFLIILLSGVLTPLQAQAGSAKPAILVFGDSLSAAYGIEQSAGWVYLLQQRLAERGYVYRVANASISGETTSGGLARLQQVLDNYHPEIVILELGANDGLRGLSLTTMRSNLSAMVERSLAHEAQVLLLGMRLPPNYGPTYTKRFHDMYSNLAKQYHTGLQPFFLDGVAGKADMVQADGLHPRAVGQGILLDNVWGALEPLLKKQAAAVTP